MLILNQFFIISKGSGWTNADLSHLEVLHHSEVCEDDAQDHHHVPDLMTVTADVVTAGVVSLWATESQSNLPNRKNVEAENV
jgi:hypothetical protein